MFLSEHSFPISHTSLCKFWTSYPFICQQQITLFYWSSLSLLHGAAWLRALVLNWSRVSFVTSWTIPSMNDLRNACCNSHLLSHSLLTVDLVSTQLMLALCVAMDVDVLIDMHGWVMSGKCNHVWCNTVDTHIASVSCVTNKEMIEMFSQQAWTVMHPLRCVAARDVLNRSDTAWHNIMYNVEFSCY